MAPPDLQQGTLDLLILTTLSGALQGPVISRRIQPQSDELLRVGQGSLYPALYRLEERGLITASWGISDDGRRAKRGTLRSRSLPRGLVPSARCRRGYARR